MKHASRLWMFAILLPILSLMLGWSVRHRRSRTSVIPASTVFERTATAVETARAPLETYHCDYRCTSPYDPGSLRVFLRNREPRPIRVTEVRLDGYPIPVWGLTTSLTASAAHAGARDVSVSGTNDLHASVRAQDEPSLRTHQEMAHRQLLWARLRPAVVQPGAIAECVVKLQSPPARPMKLSMALDGAPPHDVVLRPAARGLSISAVTFAPGFGTMHVFVCNTGSQTTELDRCELDGVDPGVRAVISPRAVAPGMKSVVSIRPPHPFGQGAVLTLRVVSREGVTAAERVRVIAGFPLATEEPGAVPVDFGLDAWPCTPPPRGHLAPRPPGPWINVLFECVMHKYRANLTRTAQQVFQLYDDMLATDPFHPGIIHPCRIRVEEGCAKFGETADAIRINPFVGRDLAGAGPAPAPHMAAWRLGRLAYDGAAPRPWYALIATGEPVCDSPQALRRLGYATIATGTKGLFFRHAQWTHTPGDAFNQALRTWIAEIRHLRAWLSEADVIPALASSNPGSLDVATLLAPGRGLVLIVINGASGWTGSSEAEIGILWPFGAAPARLSQVTANGFQEMCIIEPVEAGRLDLKLPVPRDATAFVLTCERTQP